ncbi:hypothetical protein ACFL1G_04045 [Planctomycetota bacterium]
MAIVKTRKSRNNKNKSGIVLLVTLLILVILSIVGYTLTARVSAHRHRCQYIIDYQSARYACDAGTKYALTRLQQIKPQLIDRPNDPDFSDVFAMSEEQYQQLLDEWTAEKALREKQDSGKKDPNDFANLLGMLKENSSPNIPGSNDFNYPAATTKPEEPDTVTIPGPYGPAWPMITEPERFENGSAKVKIEIQDENAKYPLGWTLLQEQSIQRETKAGFQTFCEWMGIDNVDFETLEKELDEIAEIKTFRLTYPTLKKEEKVTETRTITRGKRTIKVPKTTKKKVTIPASVHTKTFAKIFHSSMIDTDVLAKPTIESEDRKESAMKYLALWGSSVVNINTAPRHVLEAAFTFGGDAAEIAEEIIKLRKIKPFKDVDELRSDLLEYSESIDKCEKYISTTSNFFTIRVTATSGTAQASTVIAVKKDGGKMEKVAIISG